MVAPRRRDLEAFAEALRPRVARAPRTIVLVHPPKAAGTAFSSTARAAGWAALSFEGYRSARGRCATCWPLRCSRASRWRQELELADPPGVLVSVGHRPLAVGEAVAGLLRATGADVRLAMVTRPAGARLESLFRFVWRQVFRAGLEEVVVSHAGRSPTDGPAGTRRVRAHLAGRSIRPNRAHSWVSGARMSLDAVRYLEWRGGRLEIAGERWLQAFARHGVEPLSYWMVDIADIRTLQRKVAAGGVDIVPTSRLDAYSRTHLGIPALRVNVSSDTPHPMVERALDATRPLLERIAARDAAFESLVT